MSTDVSRITEWLEAHYDQTLMIRKQEADNVDETRIKLENAVTAVRNETHPEDFTAEQSLLLKGRGAVIVNGEEIPMPKDLYEIPYDGPLAFTFEEDGLNLTTDRASYRIRRET